MARIKKNIQLKPVLFIACEGTSSEFQYFESWGQSDEALANYERVEVYPGKSEKNPKTTPFEMLGVAENVLANGAADRAWLVFDKDQHPKLLETFARAEVTGIGVAFSSRSFEEWVLLHYQKHTEAFEATECKDVDHKPIGCGTVEVPNCAPVRCLTGHIRRQEFIPDYSKKKTFDLYKRIKDRTRLAIVNAAWLRFKLGSNPPLHGLNPYTDVDRLVLELLGKKESVNWSTTGQVIQLNDWSLVVSCQEQEIIIQISHRLTQPQLLNTPRLSSLLSFSNDDLEVLPVTVAGKRLTINELGSTEAMLQPSDQLEIRLEATNWPYLVFYDEQAQAKTFVMLD